VRRSLPLLLLSALLLGGCVAPEEGAHRQAEAIDDGVQATGRIDGRRVAISDGGPETVIGDCDPGDGLDDDVCWVARTIDGLTIAFVIENPGAWAVGDVLAVRGDVCRSCDDVIDHAVVDLRVDGTQRRATGGRITVTGVGTRYAAEFRVVLADGDELTGTFNVRELGPDET
jgi:hypothetical protein